MRLHVRARLFLLVSVVLAATMFLPAQGPENTSTVYRQLRDLLPSGQSVSISNFELKRDAATFSLRSGRIVFYGEVNGKITGAVFNGEGHLHIAPPTAEERHNLALQTHVEAFDEDFDLAVLRFSDSTAAELHKASTANGQSDNSFVKAAQDLQTFLRRHSIQLSNSGDGETYYSKSFYGNLDLRLLEDVLSPAPGGYFMAAMHGSKNAHLFFILDPNGVGEVAPEEVALLNWDSRENSETMPLAFHRAAEYAKNGVPSGNERNGTYRILNQDLDVGIEKNGFLTSTATVEIRAEQDQAAVIPFNLYPTLRVSQVTTIDGKPLDWVQEAKDVDPDFGVILAAPLKKGETTKIKITYSGKDVVFNKGGDNYYPVARENWYPNSNRGLGDYANYHMTFHVPKGLQIIATGTKVKENNDGKLTLTEWKTDSPLPVAGFSFGDFATKQAKIPAGSSGQLTLDAYANKQQPGFLSTLSSSLSMAGTSLGSLDSTNMLGAELAQGQVAAQLYTDYFGPLPFSHIALTQQSACNYGQSWPMLVYLPVCGFLDTTQQHFLGMGGFEGTLYWKEVTPHEVAHQWWGQTVGFSSYRDQWMSEGFAGASASIYLQATRPKPDDFLTYWQEQRRLITEKNQFGFRPIEVGPVTMGARLSSPKTGWSVYQNLVYPKGAYILHMLRMLMWSPQQGDARFKAAMQDFVATYRLKPATTEDFKAVMEKHMDDAMDLDSNQRLDWFFRQFVYGTDLPAYHFESQVTPNDKGNSLHIKLVQSGVPDSFRMRVPIYLEFADGKVQRLGSFEVYGNSTKDQTIQLPKFPSAIKKVSINHYYDVLSIDN